MTETLVEEMTVRIALKHACERAGSQRAFADSINVSEQYVSDVINGSRQPGEAIAKPLGFKPVRRWIKTAS